MALLEGFVNEVPASKRRYFALLTTPLKVSVTGRSP